MMNKALAAGAFALAVGLSYFLTYNAGETSGENKVQKKWDQAEDIKRTEIDTLKGEISVLVKQHKAAQEKLTDELALANARFEDELSGYRRDADSRLQQSNNRADVYQRQANGAASERDRLARHAAELDRSLEEGRALVRELGATLRQREVTIKALGGIILNDRTLLESE